MLEIIGTGETENDAVKSFEQDFDYIYRRYNELEESKLSERIMRIKKIINLLVKTISE